MFGNDTLRMSVKGGVPFPLGNFGIFEGSKMQYGAAYCANLQDNDSNVLMFLTERTRKGLLFLNSWGVSIVYLPIFLAGDERYSREWLSSCD